MRKKWNRPVALIAAATMIATLVTGCGGTKATEESAPAATDTAATTAAGSDTATTTTPKEAAEVTYPLADGGELTYWLALNPNVSANYTSVGETEFGKALQEQTGVTIEFQHPAAGQEKEQFNLIIADGSLPDVMEWSWVKAYPGGPEKAIKDGVIIPLNDIIDQYCPNLKKYLAENPEIDKMVKTDEGNYFSFPFVRGDEKLCYTVGGFIRQDWLDELGLKSPTTIDEWYNVLKTFKEKKGAEAPLSFDWTNFSYTNPFAYAYGVGSLQKASPFMLDDAGKIQFAPAMPAYKDYLQTMNKWYSEGLIDKDIATINGDQLTAKMTSDKSGASVGWAAGRMQMFMTNAQQANPKYMLTATPVPTLKAGETPQFGYMENQFPDKGAAITSSCKNIELAARLLDYGYSEAGHNLYNYGVEGVSYNMEGDKAVYTETMLKNPDGWPLAQSMSKYLRANADGPFVQDLNYLEQYLQLDTVKECPTVWTVENARKHTVPNITPTQDEAKELATITNELVTYADEMTLKFIFGTESFDNYDKFVKTMEDMQLSRALEIQDGALSRYNAR